jgi:hypothetical protein
MVTSSELKDVYDLEALKTIQGDRPLSPVAKQLMAKRKVI